MFTGMFRRVECTMKKLHQGTIGTVAAACAVAALVAMNPARTVAAPQSMPDGTLFDPVYYAASNPDVAAVVGTDTASLYQHYQLFGKQEGRSALEAGQTVTAETPGVTLRNVRAGSGFLVVVPAAETVTVAAAPEPAPVVRETGSFAEQFAAEMVRLINAERAQAGVAPLAADSASFAFASTRAGEMASAGTFSHTRPNGTPSLTAWPAGSVLYCGENIHMRYGPGGQSAQELAQAAHASFMGSPLHRANLLDPRWTAGGASIAPGASDGGYVSYYVAVGFHN